MPIIALGGIDICNILFTKALGFDGVALLGSIWTQPNFKKRKIKINKILEYLDNCPLSGHAFKCWGSKDFEENT